MNFLFRRSLFSAALAGGLTAQTAPKPAAPAHEHAPVALDQFVSSATPFKRNQVDLAQSTTVLAGRALLLKQRPTLGATLGGETGISDSYFGPGASRPIVRGLDGERVRILENGLALLDASANSPDHAVAVEPFLVDRIEAVRGPAALLYGNAAVGGVVNVISHRIETELHDERVRGGAEGRHATGSGETARGGVLDVRLFGGRDHAVVLHVDAFRREAGDINIPGPAESLRLRRAEIAEARAAGKPAPVFEGGTLPNSGLDAEGMASGLSWVTRNGFLGISRSGFNTDYGVPGHAHEGEDEGGVRIRLRQRRNELQGEWRAPRATDLVQGVRLKFGRGDYRHTEVEPDGAIGTVFTNRGHDGRAELLHGGGTGWNGAVGVQSGRNRFTADGEEAFLPNSTSRTEALFAFEELARGTITWQAGGRLERARIAADGHRARSETTFSGALGAVWRVAPEWTLALSATQTRRAPNAQELFADGPHAGTQAYEIGDDDLGTERSTGLEVSLRRRVGDVTGAVSVFTNRFAGYIFGQPTELVAVEHKGGWKFVDEHNPEAADHGGLPVFRTVQRAANFWGFEVEALWHLHEAPGSQFDVRFTADFVRAKEGGRPLPRLPEARAGVGLLWASAAWTFGVDYLHAFPQRQVAAHETNSDGYRLLGANVSRALKFGAVEAEAFLRATNLADREARPHTSFLKDLAPLPGRSVTAGVRFSF
jgi:iron complex outermembrane recepter protein